jgi:heterodisulfide reductase subunit B2
MDLAYYPGCSLHASSALYDRQNLRIMERLGVRLREIDDWSCCGSTSAGKASQFMALAMPARNIGLAEAMGLDEVMIPCSACYSRTLVAAERLKTDAALREEINAELKKPAAGNIKVSSILEVILARIRDGALQGKIVKRLDGLKPVCYYGCMLTRFPADVPVPDDVENPQGMERVLSAIGARALDWNAKTACCGASAAMNDNPTALSLMGSIMKDAVARGANCIVTTCPMCQLNLDAYQDATCEQAKICERLPVYFITELLGLALGFTTAELEIDRHLTGAVALLKELKLT